MAEGFIIVGIDRYQAGSRGYWEGYEALTEEGAQEFAEWSNEHDLDHAPWRIQSLGEVAFVKAWKPPAIATAAG